MKRGFDQKWQEQSSEWSASGQSSNFAQSSMLDSRWRDLPTSRATGNRPTRRKRVHQQRKPYWVLLLILMILLAGITLMKVLPHFK